MSDNPLQKIPLDHIIPNPQQPRQDFDAEALQALADSIRENGLVQPISVEATDDPELFILEDGERRWRAHRLAGLAEIEAVVRPPQDDRRRLQRALLANLHRQDLNPIEEGRAYHKLLEQLGSVSEVCRVTSVSRPTVDNRLSLLELEPEIQQMVAAGKLQKDKRVVDAILSLPAEHRVGFARQVAHPGVTVSLVRARAKQLLHRLNPEPIDENTPPALHYAQKLHGAQHTPLYDRLARQQKLPSWPLLLEAANRACKACAFYDEPAEDICRECPAVRLMEFSLIVKEDK